MTLEQFEIWLMNLPLQTLTDELKEDIFDSVKEVDKYSREDVKLKINKEVNDFIKKYSK